MGSTMSTLLASTIILLVLTPQALAADGPDFSNNMFSDLAPLLTLFGEQVTKQFLSQSLTWLEDVIFAMAPLGIITAITSAVRVGGPNWLKAVVGRARESKAVAEVELMSSTSHEVCELWNGEAIVRVMGCPKIAEILYFEDGVDEADGRGGPRLFTLKTAIKNKILRNDKEWRKDHPTKAEEAATPGAMFKKVDPLVSFFKSAFARPVPASADTEMGSIPTREHKPRRSQKASPTHTTPPGYNTPTNAPNISLNFCKAKDLRELWLFAILGIMLQFSSLIFIGVARYHPKLNLKEDENSEYAYPLMASGTLVLVTGMMACSHVVQASSEENTWVADSDFKILWLQKSARVNDQLFDSYALFGDGRRKKHITSRRRPCTSPSRTSSHTKYEVFLTCSLSNLAIIGSFISIVGFVTQFVGIRALHWSASISQLVVTLIMTAARTWIRRNMSERPRAMKLPVGDELDWLAVKFGTSLWGLWGTREPQYDRNDDISWEMIALHRYLGYEATHTLPIRPINDAKRILSVRAELGRLTDWKGISYPFALELVFCLQSLLSNFMASEDITLDDSFIGSEVFRWALPVNVGMRGLQYITMTAKKITSCGDRDCIPWDVDEFEICAVISLWCYRMRERWRASEATPNTSKPFWYYQQAEFPTVLRVLGPATREFIHENQQWIDKGGRFVVLQNSRLPKHPIEGPITIAVEKLPNPIAGPGHGNSKRSRKYITPHHIMGARPIDGVCEESLCYLSVAPLRRIMAQEILSSFLWTIAGAVRPAQYKTQSRDHENTVGERLDYKFENSFFQELAETITESGVTCNIQDAYALIFPPFASANKLPSRPSSTLTQVDIEPA